MRPCAGDNKASRLGRRPMRTRSHSAGSSPLDVGGVWEKCSRLPNPYQCIKPQPTPLFCVSSAVALRRMPTPPSAVDTKLTQRVNTSRVSCLGEIKHIKTILQVRLSRAPFATPVKQTSTTVHQVKHQNKKRGQNLSCLHNQETQHEPPPLRDIPTDASKEVTKTCLWHKHSITNRQQHTTFTETASIREPRL